MGPQRCCSKQKHAAWPLAQRLLKQAHTQRKGIVAQLLNRVCMFMLSLSKVICIVFMLSLSIVYMYAKSKSKRRPMQSHIFMQSSICCMHAKSKQSPMSICMLSLSTYAESKPLYVFMVRKPLYVYQLTQLWSAYPAM